MPRSTVSRGIPGSPAPPLGRVAQGPLFKIRRVVIAEVYQKFHRKSRSSARRSERPPCSFKTAYGIPTLQERKVHHRHFRIAQSRQYIQLRCNVVTFLSYISNACHSLSGVAERLQHTIAVRAILLAEFWQSSTKHGTPQETCQSDLCSNNSISSSFVRRQNACFAARYHACALLRRV